MGLDMYLKAEKYVSGYEHRKDENFSKVLELMNLTEEDVEKSATIGITVGYWRKANAIHNWFVQKIQKGEDNCQTSYVSRDKLSDLRNDCKAALDEYSVGRIDKASDILTPTSGFFFGSTSIDDWYKRDLEHTIKVIDKCLGKKFEGCDFYYHASW